MTHFFLEIMDKLRIVKMKTKLHFMKYDTAAKKQLLSDKKYIYVILFDQILQISHMNWSNLPP